MFYGGAGSGTGGISIDKCSQYPLSNGQNDIPDCDSPIDRIYNMVISVGVQAPIVVTPNESQTFDIRIDYTCKYNQVEFQNVPIPNFVIETTGAAQSYNPLLVRTQDITDPLCAPVVCTMTN